MTAPHPYMPAPEPAGVPLLQAADIVAFCLVAKVLSPLEELCDMLDWHCACQADVLVFNPTHRELMLAILAKYFWYLQQGERLRRSMPCKGC